MRHSLQLNFNWRYRPDFQADYLDREYDDSHWLSVDIPHTNIELPYNHFDEAQYQFISCYRKQFRLSQPLHQQRAYLTFHGVMLACEVYLNQQKVGEHKGGYTPFTLDITDAVQDDAGNQLVVKVDSRERQDIAPFGNVVDYLTYGGIYREVELSIQQPISVRDCHLQTTQVTQPEQQLTLALSLHNHLQQQTQANLSMQLLDLADGSIFDQWQQAISLNGEVQQSINLTHAVTAAKLWSLDSPNLYQLQISLALDDACIDQYQLRFGFREVCFTPQGFFLNGQPLKLRGLNRHQSYPYVGYAMPASAQRRDAEILKHELGVNMVRCSHYPQSDHFLNRCDEIGLLVFDEIPGWQHVSDDAEWQHNLLQQTQEMIEKDRNHPCVVIWGVRVNESRDLDSLYQQTNQLAHKMDSSRPTGGVRWTKHSKLLEDVYTYNDFVHAGNNQGLLKPKQVIGHTAPYLVTEHNGHMFPTKRFDPQSRLTEHALRHLRVMDQMYSDAAISGALGWCMFDYNTHKDFGSGDRICYHGVLDMFRLPKYAAAAYAMQQAEKPVLEVASNMLHGDYNAAQFGAIHLLTNCDYVELYKNERLLNRFYPDRASFPHLPFAPIVLDDFIGDQLQDDGRFSHVDSEALRELFRLITRYGMEQLSLRQKLKGLWLMQKNRLSEKDMIDIFIRYIGSWGEAATNYRIDGFRDGKRVIVKRQGQGKTQQLSLQADSQQLLQQHTYDVTRIQVRCHDEFDNQLNYESSPLTIQVSGAGQLIGPNQISLIAGATAFWVRSNGEEGEIAVSVTSPRFATQQLTLHSSIEHSSIEPSPLFASSNGSL